MTLRPVTDILFVLAACTVFAAAPGSAEPADVLVIGDINLKPVSVVVSGLKGATSFRVIVKSPREVKNTLAAVVAQEGAEAVIALGTDAVNLSLSLPETVPVIYGLVIDPPETDRKNITGVFLATPVEKYLALIGRYFPRIGKIGLIYEQKAEGHSFPGVQAVVRFAGNPYEFVETMKKLDRSIDAILLLPEKNLITATSLQKAYLFSFTEKVPLMGISEKHVKDGSLMSVVFDIDDMGRQIGDLTGAVAAAGTAEGLPAKSPEKYKVYFNRQTAESMGVLVEPELLKIAERIYP